MLKDTEIHFKHILVLIAITITLFSFVTALPTVSDISIDPLPYVRKGCAITQKTTIDYRINDASAVPCLRCLLRTPPNNFTRSTASTDLGDGSYLCHFEISNENFPTGTLDIYLGYNQTCGFSWEDGDGPYYYDVVECEMPSLTNIVITPQTPNQSNIIQIDITADDTSTFWVTEYNNTGTGYEAYLNLTDKGENNYSCTIGPYKANTNLYFYLIAEDVYGNINDQMVSSPETLLISDTINPVITPQGNNGIVTPPDPNDGGVYNFAVQYVDNCDLCANPQIQFNYWDKTTPETVISETLTLDSGVGYNGIYTFDYSDPQGIGGFTPQHTYEYTFNASDEYSNTHQVGPYEFYTKDVLAPQITPGQCDAVWTSSNIFNNEFYRINDIVTFEIQSNDNHQIGWIELEYWINTGAHKFANFTHIEVDTYSIELNFTELENVVAGDHISFIVRGYDTCIDCRLPWSLSNVNKNEDIDCGTAFIEVRENVKPVISNFAIDPTTPETGVSTDTVDIEISATITDDSNLHAVKLYYNDPDPRIANMFYDGQLDKYKYTIQNVEANITVTYQIEATDEFGNKIISSEQNFFVFDGTVPDISQVSRTPYPQNMEPIEFTATISDNVAISLVQLKYKLNSTGASENSVDMTEDHGSYEVSVGGFPTYTTMTYKIVAYDDSGNMAETSWSPINALIVGDGVEPVMEWPTPKEWTYFTPFKKIFPGQVQTTSDVNVTIRDPAGIQSVTMHYSIYDCNMHALINQGLSVGECLVSKSGSVPMTLIPGNGDEYDGTYTMEFNSDIKTLGCRNPNQVFTSYQCDVVEFVIASCDTGNNCLNPDIEGEDYNNPVGTFYGFEHIFRVGEGTPPAYISLENMPALPSDKDTILLYANLTDYPSAWSGVESLPTPFMEYNVSYLNSSHFQTSAYLTPYDLNNDNDQRYTFNFGLFPNGTIIKYQLTYEDKEKNVVTTTIKSISVHEGEPPKINFIQYPPSVYEKENITIYANVTDNAEVEKVYLKYNKNHGTYSNVLMTELSQDNYTYMKKNSYLDGDTFYFSILANDPSGNTATSNEFSIDVIEDTINPSIFNLRCDETEILSGNKHLLLFNASDNVGIKNATIEYTDTKTSESIYLAANKTIHNPIYSVSANLSASTHALYVNDSQIVTFNIWVYDVNENVVFDTIQCDVLSDEIPPSFDVITRIPAGTVYENKQIDFNATITDNVFVKKVILEYTVFNGAENSSYPNRTFIFRGNDLYTLSLGKYEEGYIVYYSIHSGDVNDNWDKISPTPISIQDDSSPPTVTQEHLPLVPISFQDFSIRLNMSDNVYIKNYTLYYTVTPDGGSPSDYTKTKTYSASQNIESISETVLLGQFVYKTKIDYYAEVYDVNNNKRTLTQDSVIVAKDSTPPTIENLLFKYREYPFWYSASLPEYDMAAYAPLNISLTSTDDVKVFKVVVEYVNCIDGQGDLVCDVSPTYPDDYTNLTLAKAFDNETFYSVLTGPGENTLMDFKIHALDVNNNSNIYTSLNNKLYFETDDSAPSITLITNNDQVSSSADVNLMAQISDNANISSVSLTYTVNGELGPLQQPIELFPGNGTWQYIFPADTFEPGDEIIAQFSVTDSSSLTTESTADEFSVIDDLAPSIEILIPDVYGEDIPVVSNPFTVRANIDDNVEMENAVLYVNDNQVEWTTVVGTTHTYQAFFSEGALVNFKIESIDKVGNTNVTPVYTVEINSDIDLTPTPTVDPSSTASPTPDPSSTITPTPPPDNERPWFLRIGYVSLLDFHEEVIVDMDIYSLYGEPNVTMYYWVVGASNNTITPLLVENGSNTYTFSTNLGTFNIGDQVMFTINATNNISKYTLSETHSISIYQADSEAPSISNIVHTLKPNINEPFNVWATITDADTGVNNDAVTLKVTITHTDETSHEYEFDMTLLDHNEYEGVVPNTLLQEGSTIDYYVEAEDNTENKANSQIFSVQVGFSIDLMTTEADALSLTSQNGQFSFILENYQNKSKMSYYNDSNGWKLLQDISEIESVSTMTYLGDTEIVPLKIGIGAVIAKDMLTYARIESLSQLSFKEIKTELALSQQTVSIKIKNVETDEILFEKHNLPGKVGNIKYEYTYLPLIDKDGNISEVKIELALAK